MKILRSVFILLCILLLLGCSSREQEIETTWVMLEENAYTFPDGVTVDTFKSEPFFSNYTYYRLKNGTNLLCVDGVSGPDNVLAGSLSLDQLSDAARSAILSYYAEQSILYDVEAILQQAYDEYRVLTNAGSDFQTLHLSQETAPYSLGEQVICFVTVLQEPVSQQICNETRLYAYFDQETGEEVPVWDLFILPEAEARTRLLAQLNDDALISQVNTALKPEYIGISSSGIEIMLPAGVMPGYDTAFGIAGGFEYYDGLLHDWAVPYEE